MRKVVVGMASRRDVSFYKDLLHKPVVDCDGRPVGALLDVSAGPLDPTSSRPCVRNLVVRPRRSRQDPAARRVAKPLVLSWDLVSSLEPCVIRLRQPGGSLGPSALDADEVLLRGHLMDRQIVDCRGLKLQRVNDLAMAMFDGTLCLWGMDTGVRGFLTRLGYRWGLLVLLRPLYDRLRLRVIRWECVDRVEAARGWIRLRVSRDEVRAIVHRTPAAPEA
jgi:sporulation protein YlmC with PRC-barrel domain